MAGIPAGLVSAGEVNTQPQAIGPNSMDNAATWSLIWFAAATVYLLGIYFGMINVASRG